MDHPVPLASSNLKKSPAPHEARLTAVQTRTVHSETFSGPLPRPDLLEAYERASPGLADRIVKMAEIEQGQRHENERREGRVNAWLQVVGQLGALGLAGIGIYAGFVLLREGRSLEGFAYFIGAVATLVGTAIYRHKHTPKPTQEP